MLVDKGIFLQGQDKRKLEVVPNSIVLKSGTSTLVIGTDYQIIQAAASEITNETTFKIKFLKEFSTEIIMEYQTRDSAITSFYSNGGNNFLQNFAQLQRSETDSTRISDKEAKGEYQYSRAEDRILSKSLVDIDYAKNEASYRIFLGVPTSGVEQIRIVEGPTKEMDAFLDDAEIEVVKYSYGTKTVDITVPNSIDSTIANHTGHKYKEVENAVVGTGEKLREGTHYTTSNDGDFLFIEMYNGTGSTTDAGLYEVNIKFKFNADINPTYNELGNYMYVQNYGTGQASNFGGAFNHSKNPYMMDNGFKNGKYSPESREIDWEVGFNYNIRSLEKAVITDLFDGNLQLKPGSMEIYTWNTDVPFVGSAQDTNAAEYYLGPANNYSEKIEVDPAIWDSAITPSTTGYGFDLNMDKLFTDPAFAAANPDYKNKPYILKYKTGFENNLVEKEEYKNTFTISYDNNINDLKSSEIKGDVDVLRGGDHATKSGSQMAPGSRYVNWSIDVNAAQSDVEDIEIYDELSTGQILLPETMKVYEAKLVIDTAGKGTLQKLATPLTLNTDYTVSAEGNKLTVKIPGEIDGKKKNKSYVVEYQSYVTAADGTNIENKLSVKGKNNTVYESSTGATTAKAFAFATASGSAITPVPTGDIVITKTAADTGNVMQGVRFSATFKIDGTPHTVYAMTDNNGVAKFVGLPAGAVVLVEQETLPGYLLDPTEREVTVTDGKETPLSITNYPVTPVTLTKFDETNTAKKLAGAVFTLQKKNEQGEYKYVNANGQIVAEADKVTWTTSSDSATLGQITIDTLPYGDYQFVELTAPVGYEKAGPFTFVIDKLKSAVEVNAPNKTSSNGTRVTLTKFNEANANVKLSGAKFRLQKKEGSEYKDVDETGQFVTTPTIFTTTADSGQIVIDNLPYGDYQFIETEAPDDYQLDTTPRKFSLSETSKSANVLAPNKIVTTTGVITLTKVDSENQNTRLPGAVFKLQQEVDGAYMDVLGYENVVTDANGQIVIPDLAFGNYQLIEIQAPTGYSLNEAPVAFMLNANKLADAQTMTNMQTPKTPGTIEIFKVDGTDATKKLAGAEFDLLLADGRIIKVGPTDINGLITVPDIPVGTHQLKETKAPTGYVLNPNPIAMTVTEGLKITQTVPNFMEPQPVGSIQVTKVDATTKDKLAGAEFIISNGAVSYKVGPTGNDGMATLGNLPIGTYTLTEAKAPTGYALSTKETVVTIAKDQVTPLTVENTKLPTTGDLKLVKVDAANKTTLLAGATFTIADGVTTKEVTTNSQGEAMLTDLTAGTYVVTETKAPTGYVLNSTPQTIRVEAGKTATLTFENVKEVELGSLVVTKVDSANNNTKLAGAQFDLILADGTVLKLGPTDANGVAKLENIPVGTHKLKETVAPTGYTLSTEELTVTIGKNTTATVTVRNEKALPITGTLRLMKVDAADASIRLGGATFTLTNGEQTQTIVTDASGLALVTGLAPGNYILTETVAPTGYQLNEKSVFVTIRANEMTEYTFSNTKKPVTPTPNPNEENPNNGTNPDAGSNPKPNPKPKDPNALTPDTGTNPNTGTNPGKTPNYVGGTTGTNTPHKKPSLLPQTNGESTMVYTLLGILLIVGSAALLFARRRKTN